MKKQFIDNAKNALTNVKAKAKIAAISASTALMMTPTTAFAGGLVANDAAGVKPKLMALAGVLLGAATAGGIIILVFGGIKFAMSYQKQDQNGESEALKTIITGLLLSSLTAIVNLIV